MIFTCAFFLFVFELFQDLGDCRPRFRLEFLLGVDDDSDALFGGRKGFAPPVGTGSARFFLCDFDVRHNRCISVLKLIPLGDNKVIIAVVDSYIEPVSLC